MVSQSFGHCGSFDITNDALLVTFRTCLWNALNLDKPFVRRRLAFADRLRHRTKKVEQSESLTDIGAMASTSLKTRMVNEDERSSATGNLCQREHSMQLKGIIQRDQAGHIKRSNAFEGSNKLRFVRVDHAGPSKEYRGKHGTL